MNRTEFRHFDRLRVRWAEVDSQQIVFNGHYLMYIDTAVASYWRALALPYHETMVALKGDLYVRKAALEYERPARYDEQLEVGVRFGPVGRTSMRIHAAVFRGAAALVHGELVYVFADPATMSSKPVPPELRTLLEDYEAGRAVTSLVLGRWDALEAEVRALRDPVFVAEQGIPADTVYDEHDAGAVHAVLRNRFGVPVACGRLLATRGSGGAEGRVGRIGRMATRAEVRGAGLAEKVLNGLVEAARARGDGELVLSSQLSAVGLYRRAGFGPEGTPYLEAGLMHQAMRRRL